MEHYVKEKQELAGCSCLRPKKAWPDKLQVTDTDEVIKRLWSAEPKHTAAGLCVCVVYALK